MLNFRFKRHDTSTIKLISHARREADDAQTVTFYCKFTAN